MKRLPGLGLMGLALGMVGCAVQVAPQTLPGSGPAGKQMTTATQQAVGANPNPREPPVYLFTAGVGTAGQPGATGEDTFRWLESLDTPAVRQWIETQNKASAPRLAALPLKATFQRRLAEIASQARRPLPPELSGSVMSPAGGLVAHRVPGGDAWEITRGQTQTLPDTVRTTSLAWAPRLPGADSPGFYYVSESIPAGVYFHRLGEPTGKDSLIYTVPDPALAPQVEVTEDGHFLLIILRSEGQGNGIELVDLTRSGSRPATLFTAADVRYRFIGASSERLYFLTTRNAPQGRIISVNAASPLSSITSVVPEGTGVLENAAFIGNRIVTASTEDARSVVRLYTPEGRLAGEVALPGNGHVEGFAANASHTGAFFTYSDYLTPPAPYLLDLAGGRAQPYGTTGSRLDTSAYITERLSVPGEEDTRVALYVTHRRDRARDGDQPLILQASGAALAPAFSPEVLAWLELGGAYAQVSVRPERRSGSVQFRHSGLDDLQAAADYLVRERYTRTRRLGLYGRGSSALAVAAAMTQRPTQLGAVVAQLTADPGDDSRPSLDTYASYRRVRKGMCYPPTLVTTLDRDTHVAPSEGYQLIASMQAVQLCSNPVLLRVDPRRGAEAAQPEVLAEQWAFLAQWLGLEAPAG